MKLTEADYYKLRAAIVDLSRTKGHPGKITLGEFMKAAGVAVPNYDLDYFMEACWKDLPADRDSAVQRILNKLQEEVFLNTGKYPMQSDDSS